MQISEITELITHIKELAEIVQNIFLCVCVVVALCSVTACYTETKANILYKLLEILAFNFNKAKDKANAPEKRKEP